MAKQPTKPKARLVFTAFINSMKRAGYSHATIEEMLEEGPLAESALVGTGVECKLTLPPQHAADTADGYFTPQGYKPAAQAAFDEFIRSGGSVTKLGYASKEFLETEARRKREAAKETKRTAKLLQLADLDLDL